MYNDGYIQGTNSKVPYTGRYIITGTTTENTVRVMEEGTYNITIKNLSIDVSNLSSDASPINANAGSKAQRCYVNITLEGNNVLYSKGMAGINFCGGRADTSVETERSTLTIEGNGYLDTECKAGYDGAGIGGHYTGAPVCDIAIESGNIISVGKGNASGIGGGLRQPVGNITINGGNIYAKKGSNASGIGAGYGSNVTVESITIKGGNLQILYGISKTPTDGKNDLYETKIKLQNIGENKKITKLITSDNIEYGINNMHTLEDGMLYLYLPKTGTGPRTITVEVEGKTYSGSVQTTETPEVVTLTQIN